MHRSLIAATVLLALAACNKPPTGGVVTIQPALPSSGDDLVAAITDFSVDPNAKDNVNYDVKWLLNGSEVADFEGSMTVDASWTNVGQSWTVQVIPRDGKSFGVPFTDSVEIINAPPVISNLRLEPTSPREGDTVRAVMDADDGDGDDVKLAYQWFVNDRDVSQTGDGLGSTHFDKGDQIHVVVTPSDDHQDGEAETSAKVTAVNSTPELRAALISPTSGATSKTQFTCTPDGWSDADDDSANYDHEWFVNGSQVSTETTLTAPDFGGGDLVYCRITPDDGEDKGTPQRSDQVEVALDPGQCDEQTMPSDPHVGKALEPYYVIANGVFAYDAKTGNARSWCSDDGLEPLAISILIYDERYFDTERIEYVCSMRLVPITDDVAAKEHKFSFDFGSGDVSYDHYGFTMNSGAFTAEDYVFETVEGDIVGGCLDRMYDTRVWGSDFAKLFEDQDWGLYVGEFASEIDDALAGATDDPDSTTDTYDLYRAGYIFGGSQQASEYVETGPLLYGLAYETDGGWRAKESGDMDDPYVRIKASTAVPDSRAPATGLYSLSNAYYWFAKPVLLGVPQN